MLRQVQWAGGVAIRRVSAIVLYPEVSERDASERVDSDRTACTVSTAEGDVAIQYGVASLALGPSHRAALSYHLLCPAAGSAVRVQHKGAFVLVISLKLQPGKAKEFLDAWAPLAAYCRLNEPRTLTYEAALSDKEDDTILIYERYVAKHDLTEVRSPGGGLKGRLERCHTPAARTCRLPPRRRTRTAHRSSRSRTTPCSRYY